MQLPPAPEKPFGRRADKTHRATCSNEASDAYQQHVISIADAVSIGARRTALQERDKKTCSQGIALTQAHRSAQYNNAACNIVYR